MFLRIVGIVLMLLGVAIAYIPLSRDLVDLTLWGGALCAFVAGAIVFGIGAIQQDVSAMREHSESRLVRNIDAATTPESGIGRPQ
jgi:hypothetical protein